MFAGGWGLSVWPLGAEQGAEPLIRITTNNDNDNSNNIDNKLLRGP